jgi:ABC-type Mn2+/Zn2+ transport system permease subunit
MSIWLNLLVYFLVALVSGALSCFVLWSRMANYTDGAAHAGVLGFALAGLLGFSSAPMVCCAIIAFAAMAHFFAISKHQTYDNLIAVISKGMVAVGIILTFANTHEAEHEGHHHTPHEVGEVFFGAHSLMPTGTAVTICCFSVLALCYIAWRRKAFMLAIIDPDLARVEGIAVNRIRFELIVLITSYIMLLMDTMGMIMISSTLTIPAASARYLARDCSRMLALAVALNVASVCAGYVISLSFDVPIGAAIVSNAFVVFIILGVFMRTRA